MISLALLRVIAVLVLVAANAFFVAAEFALVSIRETRLQQLIAAGRTGARAVLRLHRNLDHLLSAVQFGVTLTSLGLGWAGEITIAALLLPSFSRLPHAAVWAHSTAATAAFAIVTYLHITLGELVPKAVALQRAERVALAVAPAMEIFITISRPALFLFSRSARFILRLFGTKPVREAGIHSPEELKLIVTASRRVGLLHPLEEETIHRALELGDVSVREIMVPRPDIFSLPADMSIEDAMTRIVEEQHSRVPVYDPRRGPEHIIGVLYAKELMRWMHVRYTAGGETPWGKFAPMKIRNIMRGVLVVPETKSISDLLADFKQNRRHLAVVVDEFGSTAGVVTVEDVLEQLVGEMEDEFDVAPAPITSTGGVMMLEGSTNIRDLETQYQMVLPRDEGFETLAGFVLSRLQKLPQPGESFDYDGRRFTVVEMDGRRIAEVKVETISAPLPASSHAQ
jgi:CBS domain containing-hemolysin-like protein